MARQKVAIIGAGVTGLCAGCYLQMNGYDTEIFELHTLPGGLCTAWKRKGYTFDGCIHWLCHTSPKGDFYKLWDELIDMQTLEVYDYDYFIQVEDPDGGALRIPTNIDEFEKLCMGIAPEDRDAIKDLVRGMRLASRAKNDVTKAPELMNLGDLLTGLPDMLPLITVGIRWGNISIKDYTKKFKNKRLRYVLRHIMGEDIAALALVFTIADMHKRTAGYPLGGSLQFARLFEKKYLDLGGTIRYKSRVEKIIVEDDQARGVELADGDQHRADMVLSCADGYDTLYRMLDGKYTTKKLEDIYALKNKVFEPCPSLIQVSLGVARTFEGEPHTIMKDLKEPLCVDPDTEVKHFEMRVYNFDPSMSPPGKTCLTSLLATHNFEYWVNLRNTDREKYREEKQRLADAVTDIFEERFGGVRENIEVVDVATPATYIRYTNNWRGSYEGWFPVPGALGPDSFRMKKTLPGLRDFYITGQWMQPGGGLPQCIMGGRNITQIICRHDKKTFRVE